MWTYDDSGQRRTFLGREVRYQGRRVGWVTPDEIVAFLQGDIDEAGLLALAALSPEPPAGAEYVGPAPEPFVVGREEAPE